MTDNIEWHESDDSYVEAETNEVPLRTALGERCRHCDALLTWVLEPDPDSLRYSATCDQCERHYAINPTKGRVVEYE